MIPIREEIGRCDVLIVGGGMGGLMAAIAAADGGASVTVLEKADTLRSGSGTTGNDHFVCYIPEVHGTLDAFMKELRQTFAGKNADGNILRKYAARTFEVVQDWHSWGINMKIDGKWTFEGHAFPGHMRTHLKYDGHEQKLILTREARKRGVKIVNKTAVTEILTNGAGEIIGALALDVSRNEPLLTLWECKAIVTDTGAATRIYSAATPAMMFNVAGCPACTGAGSAAMYRVGATLVNMDIPGIHAGPKYFVRAGKGTWIGVLRDIEGKNIGPFVDKPSREHGDVTSDIWPSVFRDKADRGEGPVYMDCTELSEEDMKYLYWAFVCEGDTSLIEAMDKQGIDLRKHMVEFGSYECSLQGRGVQIDENCSTNIPGLYGAGDQVGNILCHVSGAATLGRIAGENAAAFVKGREQAGAAAGHPVVAEKQALYSSFMEREFGTGWRDMNTALNQLMDDYAGGYNVRSEHLLQAGIKYLNDLRQLSLKRLRCTTAHELMRALEVFDALELGELVCWSALERKETRGNHVRVDYPFTNPTLNDCFVTVTKGPDGPVTAIRQANP